MISGVGPSEAGVYACELSTHAQLRHQLVVTCDMAITGLRDEAIRAESAASRRTSVGAKLSSINFRGAVRLSDTDKILCFKQSSLRAIPTVSIPENSVTTVTVGWSLSLVRSPVGEVWWSLW